MMQRFQGRQLFSLLSATKLYFLVMTSAVAITLTHASNNVEYPQHHNLYQHRYYRNNLHKISNEKQKQLFGRIGPTEYKLTPEQIREFHTNGCCTLNDVLTEDEVSEIEELFDRFVNRQIHVPGKDFCDMSKSFDTPYEEWSIVNCMLPTRYYPPFQNNIYEQITACIIKQLHPEIHMVKDYDQFLNKRPGKSDAVFAWHQDMGYWPSSNVLGVEDITTTATFSLAIDDSILENGCLRYVPGSHRSRTLRPHIPLIRKETSNGGGDQEDGGGGDREEGHALTIDVDERVETVRYAPARRGSVTIHNEFVVHGSGGNKLPDKQRRTYVLAYRPKTVVDAERSIGFTHSHNDQVNWDTFQS